MLKTNIFCNFLHNFLHRFRHAYLKASQWNFKLVANVQVNENVFKDLSNLENKFCDILDSQKFKLFLKAFPKNVLKIM